MLPLKTSIKGSGSFHRHHCGYLSWGFTINQWIGLREILQETPMIFMGNQWFPVKMFPKPIHWIKPPHGFVWINLPQNPWRFLIKFEALACTSRKKKKHMWRCPKMGPKTSSKSSSKVIKSHQKSPVIDYLNNWKSMKKSLKPVFYGYLWAFTLSKTGSNDQPHEISRAPVARRGHRGASRCAVASARCGSLRWWSQRATRRAQCLAKWRKVNGDSMGDFSSIFHGVIFLDLVEV